MVDKAKRGDISRSALRSLSSGAAFVKPDTQGRIAIPSELRAFAGLEHDVIVIGAFDQRRALGRRPLGSGRPFRRCAPLRAQLNPNV